MKIKNLLVSIFATSFILPAVSQVRIGDLTPAEKGTVLDLSSSTYIGGLKLPNVIITDFGKIPAGFTETTVQGQDVNTALTGIVVYNTNASTGVGVYTWDGDNWVSLGSNGVQVTGVTVSPTSSTIISTLTFSGQTVQLIPTVSPSNATNKNIIWSSSNATIATVSSTGLVTAVSSGTATITAMTVDGGKIANSSITVLIFMDQNLGADNSADSNPAAYNAGSNSSPNGSLNGGYYQWGRVADGHQQWNSILASGPVNADNGNNQVPQTNTDYYGKFIMAAGNWRNTDGDNSWTATGGSGNPCPTGYHVPTESEWTIVNNSITAANLSNITSSHQGINIGSSNLFLPAGGRRYGGNGSFGFVGTDGYYWSSTVYNSSLVYHFFFLESGSGISSNAFRSNGYSVRCVKN